MKSNEESRMVCLSLLMLLEGALNWLEGNPDSKTLEERGDANLRARVFRQDYWLTPFGSVSFLRSSILRRVHCVRDDGRLPDSIAAVLGFIHARANSFDAANYSACVKEADYFREAIRECKKLLNP